MAIINTNGSFGASDTVNSTNLNAVADAATFNDPVDEETLELITTGTDDGKLRIKTGGVGTNQIAGSAVTKAKIEDVANMKVLGNTSGAATAPQEVDVIDDDTMATALDTNLATAGSIKAYVDTYKPNFALATKSDAQTIPTNENVWNEITNLNPTITTKASGSTFIVTPSINWGAYNQYYGIGFKVMYSVNGGVYQDFGLPAGIGSRVAVHAEDSSVDDAGSMSRATFDVFLDSISYSIGDTISFKVYAQNPEAGQALYINRSESDTNNNDHARSISTIKVQEIYQ
jgi:hypothetical protein